MQCDIYWQVPIKEIIYVNFNNVMLIYKYLDIFYSYYMITLIMFLID